MTAQEIVVGVDGSETAALALRWAAREGRLRGLAVRAVLAWDAWDQHHAVISPAFDLEYGDADAEAALHTYLKEALDDDAVAVRTKVVNDLPARALVEASAEAFMLVVGGRPMGQAKQLLVGSVTSQCLSNSLCPVVVVHGTWGEREREQTGRVVVGVDGSPSSAVALRFAADEARARNATLEVVHAWRPPITGGLAIPAASPSDKVAEHAAHRVVSESVKQLVDQETPATMESSILKGDAASELVARSEQADLVVVGSRGRGGFAGLLLGSVARRVSRLSHSPVVVVPSHHAE